MKFSILNRLLLLLVTIELVGCGGSGGSSDNTTTADPDAEAIYQLTFQANWDNVEFPTNYPSNAHFSGLIGATHNDQKTFWAPSQLPQQGFNLSLKPVVKAVLPMKLMMRLPPELRSI